MTRTVALLALTALLSGCGVVETGTSAAASAASGAQAAEAAKRSEDHVKAQIDAASQQAAEQRRAAEEAIK
jgi:uncharacterized protein YceK